MSTPAHPFDEAYFVGGAKSNYEDYRLLEPAIDAGFMPVVLEHAERAAQGQPGGAYLDVGCAMGFYVERFAGLGWDAYGVDLSEYAVEEGRRRGVRNLFVAGVDELPFADETFRFVTAIDVIEHVPAAMTERMVSELRRVLAPGATCFVATPNFLSNRHWNVDVPGFYDKDTTHVNYQSVESLRAHFSSFETCAISGHTPFVEQFQAFDASRAGDAFLLRHPRIRAAARRVAWKLLGRDVDYSSYLHAAAVK